MMIVVGLRGGDKKKKKSDSRGARALKEDDSIIDTLQ